MAVDLILDAGHGGFDLGASYMGRAEKDDVLKLTMAVGAALQREGYNVYYTRNRDVYQTPYEKAELANESKGNYLISFHRNSGVEDNLYSGVQTLVYEPTAETQRLGRALNAGLEKVGFKNLGIEAIPDLILLRESDMPAVLLEVGFINSDADNQLFDERFEDIVAAIVDAVEETLPMSAQEMPTRYHVQTGLFKYDVNAAYQLERLQMIGYDGTIHYEKPYYAVWVGDYSELDDAVELQKNLRQKGYATLVVSR